MINRAVNLVKKYYVQKIYVDACDPAIITSLKQQLDDRVDYDRASGNQTRWLLAVLGEADESSTHFVQCTCSAYDITT